VKRKSADRVEWPLTATRFTVARVDEPGCAGYATLLCVDAVAQPLRIERPPVCLADAGYSLLQHYPDGARHVLLTVFDAAGQPVLWYFDVVERHGLDERGVPWLDDLYLDLAVLPSGRVDLLDADELEDALARGLVTPEQHAMAWEEVARLRDAIGRGAVPWVQLGAEHRRRLLGTLTQRGISTSEGAPARAGGLARRPLRAFEQAQRR
jgi:predicted RNA-binding protein associated with RNAse of E/G family